MDSFSWVGVFTVYILWYSSRRLMMGCFPRTWTIKRTYSGHASSHTGLRNLICKILHRKFQSEIPNKRGTNILAVLRFETPFDRDVFRFDPFSTFRETTFERVRSNTIALRRKLRRPQSFNWPNFDSCSSCSNSRKRRGVLRGGIQNSETSVQALFPLLFLLLSQNPPRELWFRTVLY